MKMTYDEFLKRVVDEGIEAARSDYTKPEDKPRLEGSIEGFEACRNKNPMELTVVLSDVRKATQQAYRDSGEGKISGDEYWKIRCREAEAEWVCNCVSALLANAGMPPIDSLMPTARGVMKAASIVGVSEKKK